jgi:hypothetical protein
VRLLFDTPPSAGALSTPSLYAVTAPGAAPVPVVGLVLIAGQPQNLDLVLGADLQPGIVYTVAADGSGSAVVMLGVPSAQPDVELADPDIDALLYGIDLVWTGTDYAEGADGDLATVSGVANVEAALGRRFTSDGLPWDDTYGAKPRAYVDGAPAAASALKGALVRQAQLDDRVETATASLTIDGTDATFEVDVELIGDGDKVNVPVTPNAGS